MLDVLKTLFELKEFLWSMVGLIFAITIGVSLLRAHKSGVYNKFNLLDAFAVDGKFSGSKSRMNLAFIISSWTLILVAAKINNVTSDFVMLFGSYLTAFVADRQFSRISNNKPESSGSNGSNPGGERTDGVIKPD